MKTYKIALLVLSSVVITLAACSKYGNELSYVEYGTLSVQLTDAPFPYDFVSEANVTIFKIDARHKNPSDTENLDDNSNFITLFEGEMTVNLLELTNGVTKSMGEIEVPVGTYDLVRVYVSNGNVLLTDGTIYDLKVPSGEQTGIKVFIKPSIEVVTQLSSDLLLDFDVNKSFVPKGNVNAVSGITGFNFKPVIRASNMSMAGSLSGMISTVEDEVSMPLEGAMISVFSGDTQVTSAFSDATGGYTILGLEAGSYRVVVEALNYAEASVEVVTIVVANETSLDFELTLN
ncbi:DUF4382 domain-containing protein [Maribacter aestuarii]|uniref:DUF4382 domain-containing protein n=1 Tax=Maribacter aestuarii TaxID=1130723 RepID=UPI00248C730B|nr:DUF4382 domain-containing protein [Maribacter aestuarii]